MVGFQVNCEVGFCFLWSFTCLFSSANGLKNVSFRPLGLVDCFWVEYSCLHRLDPCWTKVWSGPYAGTQGWSFFFVGNENCQKYFYFRKEVLVPRVFIHKEGHSYSCCRRLIIVGLFLWLFSWFIDFRRTVFGQITGVLFFSFPLKITCLAFFSSFRLFSITPAFTRTDKSVMPVVFCVCYPFTRLPWVSSKFI